MEIGTVALLLVGLAVGAGIAVLLTRAQHAALANTLRSQAGERRAAELHSAVEHVITVANERLGAHTSAASGDLAATKGLIDARLGHLSHDLGRVADLVGALERQQERRDGALTEQISAASAQTADLAETTRQLREALASTKARGQWGERMAEDVLRLAGFAEGVNYIKQRAIVGGGIPDFRFFLPEDREVRMDVKFPLDNYLRSLRAADEVEAARHRKTFLGDVRARVSELAKRTYVDPERTVDCVLLFIPNEALYAYVQEHDAGLLDHALQRKVVLCSPMTLFAVLAVIRQAVDAFALARTTDEILTVLGGFTKQWGKFTDQLEGLGTHLERSQRAYEALSTTRRRQLERQLDRIEDLRAGRGAGALEVPPPRPLEAAAND